MMMMIAFIYISIYISIYIYAYICIYIDIHVHTYTSRVWAYIKRKDSVFQFGITNM